jgi:hypothetical protein
MDYTLVDLSEVANAEKKDWGAGVLIFSDEWSERRKQVLGFLASKSGEGEKLNARDCVVKEISGLDARPFLEDHHIQGSNNLSLVFFGLFHDSGMVAVMSLGRHSRNISENRIVLDRFCVRAGAIVRGGASKLFGEAMKWAKERKYDEIVSFSDNRLSDGKVYEVLGFYMEKEHKSDYFYVDLQSGRRLSKQSQMKSSSKCPAGMTESQWAKQRGLVRFWDKGKKRWVFPLNESFVSWTKRLSEKCANQNKNGDFKQSHIRGYFKSKKNGKDVYYGSSYELRCVFLLEEDADVVSYDRGECFEDSKGKFRNPDLFVVYLDGKKEILEVKPKSRLGEEDVVEQVEESRRYSAEKEMGFKVWTEDNSGFDDAGKIVDWAREFLAERGDPKWKEAKKASSVRRSKKYYDAHIATDKVSVFCEYCQVTHEALRLTHDKNIARNGRYICEREGGHIAGSRPKPHLRKANPHAAEGKKECLGCKQVLSFSEYGADKSRSDGYASKCKECRRVAANEKYSKKRAR